MIFQFLKIPELINIDAPIIETTVIIIIVLLTTEVINPQVVPPTQIQLIKGLPTKAKIDTSNRNPTFPPDNIEDPNKIVHIVTTINVTFILETINLIPQNEVRNPVIKAIKPIIEIIIIDRNITAPNLIQPNKKCNIIFKIVILSSKIS